MPLNKESLEKDLEEAERNWERSLEDGDLAWEVLSAADDVRKESIQRAEAVYNESKQFWDEVCLKISTSYKKVQEALDSYNAHDEDTFRECSPLSIEKLSDEMKRISEVWNMNPVKAMKLIRPR